MMVLRTAQQIEGGLPADIRAMMMFNIIIDFVIGLVPFLGDVADALFRANTRNAIILENHLRKKGAAALKAQGKPAPTIDPSDPVEFDRHIEELPPTPPESREGASAAGATYGTTGAPVRNNQKTTSNAASQSGGGFFGKKTKQTDLEQGRKPTNRPR